MPAIGLRRRSRLLASLGSEVSQRILIVNADDLGLSEGVNRGVATAFEKGIVTSASLMVRRPAAAAAALYSQQHPELSVGLHVDMGEWEFRDGDWKTVHEPPADAEGELQRQLNLFRRLIGRDPTHVDSHQHVHRSEPLASSLRRLAAELDVPLRGYDTSVIYCGDFYGQTAKGDLMHDAIGVNALLELIDGLDEGTTELGCHPGIAVDDLAYGVERSIELQALCSPVVRDRIEAKAIALRSFANAISAARPTVGASDLRGEVR